MKKSAQIFREAASAVPKLKQRKAREQADKLVTNMVKTCIERARVAAVEDGLLSTTFQLDRPMVSGDLITEQVMIAELVHVLQGEGFAVQARIDNLHSTNLPKLFVTMQW